MVGTAGVDVLVTVEVEVVVVVEVEIDVDVGVMVVVDGTVREFSGKKRKRSVVVVTATTGVTGAEE